MLSKCEVILFERVNKIDWELKREQLNLISSSKNWAPIRKDYLAAGKIIEWVRVFLFLFYSVYVTPHGIEEQERCINFLSCM